MATPRKYTHDLKYDFLALPAGRMLVEEYPQLLMYPEIAEHGTGENARWLNYCVLLTDIGSGLLKTADLHQRHREALRLVGIDEKHPRADAALLFTDEGVTKLCHALLRDSDNMLLAWVLSAEKLLWNSMYNPDVDREEFFDDAPGRIDQLNEGREKLFRKDKQLEKAVVADVRQNEGIVERMVREKNQAK